MTVKLQYITTVGVCVGYISSDTMMTNELITCIRCSWLSRTKTKQDTYTYTLANVRLATDNHTAAGRKVVLFDAFL